MRPPQYIIVNFKNDNENLNWYYAHSNKVLLHLLMPEHRNKEDI